MPLIEIKNLSFSYLSKDKTRDIEVFKDLNISFAKDKFNILLGESGSGKTTLLNIISGIEMQYDGEVLYDNVDACELSIKRRNMSYMPQNYMIYHKMTVFENIAFPLRMLDFTPEEIMTRVRNIAKKFGIAHCLSRKPKDLSLGQQQRMMLAKVLVKDPALILLDEALTSLDPLLKEELYQFIKESKEELNATIIYVTHDYKEAFRYGEMIYVLEDSQVVISGTPKELRDSKHPYLVALKKSSVLEDLK